MGKLRLMALLGLLGLMPGAALGQPTSPAYISMRDCTGQTINRVVTILPLDGPLGFYNTNIVVSDAITLTPVNGVATTNLAAGDYRITFAGYPRALQIFWPADPTITNVADARIQSTLLQAAWWTNSGGSSVTGAVVLVPGANVSITTNGVNNFTIAATGGGSSAGLTNLDVRAWTNNTGIYGNGSGLTNLNLPFGAITNAPWSTVAALNAGTNAVGAALAQATNDLVGRLTAGTNAVISALTAGTNGVVAYALNGTNDLNTALVTRLNAGTNAVGAALAQATNDLVGRLTAGTNGVVAYALNGTNDLNTALVTRLNAGTNAVGAALAQATNDLVARITAGTNADIAAMTAGTNAVKTFATAATNDAVGFAKALTNSPVPVATAVSSGASNALLTVIQAGTGIIVNTNGPNNYTVNSVGGGGGSATNAVGLTNGYGWGLTTFQGLAATNLSGNGSGLSNLSLPFGAITNPPWDTVAQLTAGTNAVGAALAQATNDLVGRLTAGTNAVVSALTAGTNAVGAALAQATNDLVGRLTAGTNAAVGAATAGSNAVLAFAKAITNSAVPSASGAVYATNVVSGISNSLLTVVQAGANVTVVTNGPNNYTVSATGGGGTTGALTNNDTRAVTLSNGLTVVGPFSVGGSSPSVLTANLTVTNPGSPQSVVAGTNGAVYAARFVGSGSNLTDIAGGAASLASATNSGSVTTNQWALLSRSTEVKEQAMRVPTIIVDNYPLDGGAGNPNEASLTNQIRQLLTNGWSPMYEVWIDITANWLTNRQPNGLIAWDTNKFPNGIPYIVNYAHSNAMKILCYREAGRPDGNTNNSYGYGANFASTTNTMSYCEADVAQLMGWGFDGIRCDIPGNPGAGQDNGFAAYAAARVSAAMQAYTNQSKLEITSGYDHRYPHPFAPSAGGVWEASNITGDLITQQAATNSYVVWDQYTNFWTHVTNAVAEGYMVGPGHLHLLNWCPMHLGEVYPAIFAMEASPIPVSRVFDNQEFPPATTLFTNTAFKQVWQDPLVRSATMINSSGFLGSAVLVKPLVNGDVAVLFWNASTNTTYNIGINLAQVGLSTNVQVNALDVVYQTNTLIMGTLTNSVPAMGCKMWRLSPLPQMFAASTVYALSNIQIQVPGGPASGQGSITIDAAGAFHLQNNGGVKLPLYASFLEGANGVGFIDDNANYALIGGPGLGNWGLHLKNISGIYWNNAGALTTNTEDVAIIRGGTATLTITNPLVTGLGSVVASNISAWGVFSGNGAGLTNLSVGGGSATNAVGLTNGSGYGLTTFQGLASTNISVAGSASNYIGGALVNTNLTVNGPLSVPGSGSSYLSNGVTVLTGGVTNSGYSQLGTNLPMTVDYGGAVTINSNLTINGTETLRGMHVVTNAGPEIAAFLTFTNGDGIVYLQNFHTNTQSSAAFQARAANGSISNNLIEMEILGTNAPAGSPGATNDGFLQVIGNATNWAGTSVGGNLWLSTAQTNTSIFFSTGNGGTQTNAIVSTNGIVLTVGENFTGGGAGLTNLSVSSVSNALNTLTVSNFINYLVVSNDMGYLAATSSVPAISNLTSFGTVSNLLLSASYATITNSAHAFLVTNSTYSIATAYGAAPVTNLSTTTAFTNNVGHWGSGIGLTNILTQCGGFVSQIYATTVSNFVPLFAYGPTNGTEVNAQMPGPMNGGYITNFAFKCNTLMPNTTNIYCIIITNGISTGYWASMGNAAATVMGTNTTGNVFIPPMCPVSLCITSTIATPPVNIGWTFQLKNR